MRDFIDLAAGLLLELDKSTTNSSARLIASEPEEIDEDAEYPDWADTDDLRARYDDLMNGSTEAERKEANFKRWFGDSKVVDDAGKPQILFHGTGTEISSFKGMVWGSVTDRLAKEYAAMRELDGGQANVIPMFMRIINPFDADLGLPKTVTIGSFMNAVAEQALDAGRELPIERAKELLNIIRDCAREEESGPHYDRHNFWNEPYMAFGAKGAAAIKEMFEIMGFDGIKMIENGEITYGAFSPNQVKSIWNKGEFSDGDDIFEDDDSLDY